MFHVHDQTSLSAKSQLASNPFSPPPRLPVAPQNSQLVLLSHVPSGIHALPSSQFTPSDHSLIPNYFPGQPAGKQANVCATFSAFNDHDRTSLLSPTTMHFPASLPPGPVACIRRLVRLESGLALTLHFCLAPVALAPRTSRLYDQVHSQTSDATVGCRALPRMYWHPTVAVSNVPQEMKGSFYIVIPVVSC